MPRSDAGWPPPRPSRSRRPERRPPRPSATAARRARTAGRRLARRTAPGREGTGGGPAAVARTRTPAGASHNLVRRHNGKMVVRRDAARALAARRAHALELSVALKTERRRLQRTGRSRTRSCAPGTRNSRRCWHSLARARVRRRRAEESPKQRRGLARCAHLVRLATTRASAADDYHQDREI